MSPKTSLLTEGSARTIVDGVRCSVIRETLAEVDDSGAVTKVMGKNQRFEFLERWKLRHLVLPRKRKRVVVSEVPEGRSKEGGLVRDGVFFVTVDGDTSKTPEKASDGDDAMKKARALVRDLFFGP
jgi:hypothetical protein